MVEHLVKQLQEANMSPIGEKNTYTNSLFICACPKKNVDFRRYSKLNSFTHEFHQNNEEEQFNVLKARFDGPVRRKGKNRQIQITFGKSFIELKDYFPRYLLRGQKHIAQSH